MTRLSEDNTEDLIRKSLERLATRAPDGSEIRDALNQRSRSRSRMALALVAAAVAIIALGVPLGLRAYTAVPPASPRNADWAVLPYKPGWLPDGFKEAIRCAKPYPAPQTRDWSAGDRGQIQLTTTPLDDRRGPWTIAPAPNQIIVHGRVGMVTEVYGDATMLTWSPDDIYLLSLTLYGVKEPREVGQRIADEMVKDDRARVSGELRFGRLPADLALSGVKTFMRVNGGATELEATNAGQPAAAAVVTASIGGERPEADGAEPVTVKVRGVDGLYLPVREGRLGHQDETVAVQLGDGRWLTVWGKRDRATLLDIAENLQIIPGDYSWFGKPPE
ncbi:hypothetical protein [Amycolatopsis regifaucium]|uniref:Uncharacterized protein n=1 Tax=Amycolatopsis regifaucium TaxID=546365 RepID=A0A154MNN4_9PSEU|nr:hypothetical protein [Amycolatopsis regifaucium]KZB85700.1 hypothetical protein AVL48_30050 [Amycolatopsis regifaucium]OKA10545.1 hypothetical protein ATP06_0203855 [Amycolatopsis regifaucium]SFI81600.1 hypothetical protein SAMN04489731_113142 [Amycolatopsis regifaucium]